MAKQPKNKKDDVSSKAKDTIIPSSDTPSNNTLYGEYYNKNTLYIYKDNSTTRVSYGNKSDEYIERKYI